MKSLEEQLSELLAESDRVSAELHRELFLIGRANDAIGYLRDIRAETARRVESLLEQRALGHDGASDRKTVGHTNGERRSAGPRHNAFGLYDPEWPQ